MSKPRHLFIITYGRSGSTALQMALNAIPGFLIRGENFSTVGKALKAVMSAQDSKRQHGTENESHRPWFGAGEIDADGFADDIANAITYRILQPKQDTRVVGFKEIRWLNEFRSNDRLKRLMWMLLHRFHDTRIIFLKRDPAEVAQSGWWAEQDTESVIAELTWNIETFERLHSDFPDKTFMLDHSDFAGDPNGLRPLLEWLGEGDHADLAVEALDRQLHHLKDAKGNPPTEED